MSEKRRGRSAIRAVVDNRGEGLKLVRGLVDILDAAAEAYECGHRARAADGILGALLDRRYPLVVSEVSLALHLLHLLA